MMNKFKIGFISVLLFLGLCLISQPVSAQTSSSNSDWKYMAAIYFWMAGMDGDIAVRGTQSPVDASFSDIWDNLDIAFMGHVEVEKSPWIFLGDILYFDLEDDEVGPVLGSTKVTIKQTLFELMGGYQIYRGSISDKSDQEMILELLGGGRYAKLDGRIRGSLGNVDISGDKSWVDPLIGARLKWILSEKWSLVFRGDIGGFGIGSASDLTWDLNAGVFYKFTDAFFVGGGYRVIDIDKESGSGSDKFIYDVTSDGPWLAAGFTF